ncbi:hypothetical protein [Mesorhizobium sp.]|uniref:hypothetical protein n=1 Tax=Mesorhizobium sp. TaxID=1871066 RepID=UPI0011F44DED|nr:hypothetical protein [Mesorhizobium sp.]TIN74628.1 MAG: hypothetical protein E5Y09_31955 [Mesorhizobium sp.]TIO65595.1 MAG: hypothetical protein E5X85_28100 [Mesorhizobium sp.]TJV85511.1 MAG: hypothetical protein E5X84_32245 [Mesorhizobium sp.]
MTPREGEYLVKLLLSRNGSVSIVTLSNGSVHRVFNIVPGRDAGEQFDHISTNIAVLYEDRESDFFYASEVCEIATEDGTVCFARPALKFQTETLPDP